MLKQLKNRGLKQEIVLAEFGAGAVIGTPDLYVLD